jgi:hypothetical protein
VPFSRILYVSLSPSPVQYEQVYWIFFCFFALFSQTSYFFSLENVGMLIVTSDPPYADMTQFHQLNIQKITFALNRTEAKLASDISF